MSQVRGVRSRNLTLLILGGSQGAAGLNAMATAAVIRLRDRLHGWRIVHQTGERDAEAVRHAYASARIDAEVAPFFPGLPRLYADARLAVTRAGATTLAELACLGVPALLVPYPGSARDHQARNADRFVDAGAGTVVTEGPSAADRLTLKLATLLDDPQRLDDMADAGRRLAAPDAAARVADLLLPRRAVAAAA